MKSLLCPLFALVLSLNLFAQQKTSPYTDSLKASLDKEQHDTMLVNTYNLLAGEYRYIDPALNREYALKALKKSRAIGYQHGMQSGYNLLAQSYENQGLFPDAILYYDSSLAMTKVMKSKSDEAKILLNIANVYQKTADYSAAAEYAMNSLTLQEQLKDTFGIAVCRLTLGNIEYGQGDYKSSLRNYISAMELNRRSAKNPQFEGSTVANIGAILDEQGSYDSALVFFRQSLVIFHQLKANAKAASAYNNVGACFFHLGQFDSAQHYLHIARAMNEELQRPEGLVPSLLGLGHLHDSLNNRDSSLYYYRLSYRLAMQYNLKEDLLRSYRKLAATFEKSGKLDSALHYLHLYIDLNALIHGEDELRKIEQEDQNYNIRKKQEEMKQQQAQAQLDKDVLRDKIGLLAAGIVVLLLISLLLFSRFRSKQQIANMLEHKNKEITQQKDEITDSINYARRIQDAILPPLHAVKQVIPDSFIFYLPKDVVSGDFYWVEEESGHRIFASVDCTGHGVPGALMSVVGFNLLNRAVKELHLTKPSDILRELDYGVNKLLRQSESEHTVKDGMDISLCSYVPETRMLQYAGVFNPLYIVRNGQLSQVKADKSPIGVNVDGVADSYTNHEIPMLPGDMVYLFSDGYADQFGGTGGKKYKYNKLREFFVSISPLSAEEQQAALRVEFNSWKGEREQVDDVLIIGMRIH